MTNAVELFLSCRFRSLRILVMLWLCSFAASLQEGHELFARTARDSTRSYTLENTRVRLGVTFANDRLLGDRLETRGAALRPVAVETDAGFGLDIMYTDWQAPGKANNADNPVILTKKDFALVEES